MIITADSAAITADATNTTADGLFGAVVAAVSEWIVRMRRRRCR